MYLFLVFNYFQNNVIFLFYFFITGMFIFIGLFLWGKVLKSKKYYSVIIIILKWTKYRLKRENILLILSVTIRGIHKKMILIKMCLVSLWNFYYKLISFNNLTKDIENKYFDIIKSAVNSLFIKPCFYLIKYYLPCFLLVCFYSYTPAKIWNNSLHML